MILKTLKKIIKSNKLLYFLTLKILKFKQKYTFNNLLYNNKKLEQYVQKEILKLNSELILRKNFRTVCVIWEGSGRLKYIFQNKNKDKINLIKIPRSLFTPAWTIFLKTYLDENSKNINLGEYALDSYYKKKFANDRKNFRKFCAKIIDLICLNYDVDLFLMPKLNDDWTIDFIDTLNQKKKKILVDDRESTITLQRLKKVSPKLKKLVNIKFNLLTAHNDLHKQLFINGGFDKNRIVVNGAPETDFWFYPKEWKSAKELHPDLSCKKIKILFFSFGPRTYLNFYYGNETRTWNYLNDSYHNVIFKLLEQYSDRIQIIYKFGGKPLRDLYYNYDKFILKSERFIKSKSLLILDGTYNSQNLTLNSDIILGFQTSGVIEAMFTKKPIVYGAWGSFYNDIKNTLLPLHDDKLLNWCKSENDLYLCLDELINNDYKRKVDKYQLSFRKKIRDFYFKNSDGMVSERIINYCYDIINLKKFY